MTHIVGQELLGGRASLDKHQFLDALGGMLILSRPTDSASVLVGPLRQWMNSVAMNANVNLGLTPSDALQMQYEGMELPIMPRAGSAMPFAGTSADRGTGAMPYGGAAIPYDASYGGDVNPYGGTSAESANRLGRMKYDSRNMMLLRTFQEVSIEQLRELFGKWSRRGCEAQSLGFTDFCDLMADLLGLAQHDPQAPNPDLNGIEQHDSQATKYIVLY